MIKILFALLLLLSSLTVTAEITFDPIISLFTINPVDNVNGGLQTNYFHIRASTTGYMLFSINRIVGETFSGSCNSYTPVGESPLERPIEVISKASGIISWSNDCNTVIGDNEDGIPYIISDDRQTISKRRIRVHSTENNKEPIKKDTMQFNGVEYDTYESLHVPSEIYHPSDISTDTFKCAIEADSTHALMLKKLGYDEPRKGIIYFIYTSGVTKINNIYQCGYGVLWLTSYRY